MFFLKKLITSAMLPPGIFIIMFIIIGVWVKRKSITILSLLCALLLYALSIEPVKDILFYHLEKQAYTIVPGIHVHKINITSGTQNELNPINTIDAIVILGGGVYENGNFKEDSVNRLLAGYFLYTTTGKPIILSGGSAGGNIPESYTMYSVLQRLNVKKQDIIIESQSRDTDDNALNVIKICERKNYRSIALVTSAYHMPRAYKLFGKSSVSVTPVLCDSKLDMRYTMYSFLPQFSSFANSTKAVREYIALAVLCLAESF
ncbi:MAG: YdcF family protein [Spirochaetota bacterium]|nr:YdcF family protein [Spirochaetota bacterium]